MSTTDFHARRSVSVFLLSLCVLATAFALVFIARRNPAGAESRTVESKTPVAKKSGSRLKGRKEDVFKTKGEKDTGCCGAKTESTSFNPMAAAEYESYKLTAVYYSVRDSLTTTLMLNNKGPQPLPAVPTLYSMAGTRLSLAPIIVPAASYIEVNMADLLAGAAEEFREGSMKIGYEGGNMQMGVQVRMIDTDKKLIWAEQFVYGSKLVSSRLEGVWYLPYDNSKTRLAVSNTSSQTLTATIETDGAAPAQSAPYQLTLAPWETRMLDIMSDLVGNANGHLKVKGGVSIKHTGSPGGILARMYIGKPSKGYSASVPFVDPEATGSQKWHGAGLRLRMDGDELDSVLVARNNGDQPTTVSGRIPYTRPNGSMDEVAIPSRTIPANQTRIIDLGDLISSAKVPNVVKFAGIEVNYSTSPGSVTTSVQSTSQNGEHVFQVPMLDPTKLPSSAGGYPWKADGDFRTLLYIKNVTDSVQKYTASMLYPTGGGYSIGQREIKPGQTIAVDFKKLRDEQTPDDLGNIIPLDLEHAQLAFSGFGPDGKILSGRAEQISQTGGIASTYACVNCCGDSPNDAWLTPYGEEVGVGDTLGLVAVQEMRNCAYQVTGSFPIFADSWSSSSSSIATVDSFGEAEGIAPGNTLITAQWNMGYWLAENGVCVHHNDLSQPSAPVEVPPLVNIIGLPSAEDGSSIFFTAAVSGGSPTGYQWSFTTPTGSGNNPNLSFQSPTALSTFATAKWFAYPNGECTASPQSTYTVKVIVSFSGRDPISTQKSFQVTIPREGGIVEATPQINGAPSFGHNQTTGVWSIAGPGTLTYNSNAQKTIHLPNSSQFFSKIDSHENVHLGQWSSTGLFGQHFAVTAFFNRIAGFTDTSHAGLSAKVQAEYNLFKSGALQAVSGSCNQSEIQAHATSDSISPQFYYQRCGATSFECPVTQ